MVWTEDISENGDRQRKIHRHICINKDMGIEIWRNRILISVTTLCNWLWIRKLQLYAIFIFYISKNKYNSFL